MSSPVPQLARLAVMAASMGPWFDVARSRQDLRVYIGTWQRHGVRIVATVRGTVLSALAIVVCVTSVSNHDTQAATIK